jgi:hypothetical protein
MESAPNPSDLDKKRGRDQFFRHGTQDAPILTAVTALAIFESVGPETPIVGGFRPLSMGLAKTVEGTKFTSNASHNAPVLTVSSSRHSFRAARIDTFRYYNSMLYILLTSTASEVSWLPLETFHGPLIPTRFRQTVVLVSRFMLSIFDCLHGPRPSIFSLYSTSQQNRRSSSGVKHNI